MRHITFLLLTLVMVLITILFGCESQNPICSENFCLEGEIFPRSEIGNREFSEVDIDDAVIFATFANTTLTTPATEPIPVDIDPTPKEGITKTTIATIVSDTLAGGTRFEGTLVELTGTVDWIAEDDDALTFKTNNPDIDLFVRAYGDLAEGTFKNAFTTGETYTVQLYIEAQEFGGTFGNNVWSFPIEDIVNTTVGNIVSDTLANGKAFEGKVVEITATVRFIADDNGYMTIEANNDDVRFTVNPSGDILEGTFKRTFITGESYTLQLYIREQEKGAVNYIRSHLVG